MDRTKELETRLAEAVSRSDACDFTFIQCRASLRNCIHDCVLKVSRECQGGDMPIVLWKKGDSIETMEKELQKTSGNAILIVEDAFLLEPYECYTVLLDRMYNGRTRVVVVSTAPGSDDDASSFELYLVSSSVQHNIVHV